MKLAAPTLYVENSFEAVELYKEAFGLTLGYHLSYEDIDGLKAWGLKINDDYKPYKGYFHADLMNDGITIFCVSGEGYTLKSGHNVQFSLHLGSEEAVNKAYSVLSVDAISTDEHSFIDKHGIWWGLGV